MMSTTTTMEHQHHHPHHHHHAAHHNNNNSSSNHYLQTSAIPPPNCSSAPGEEEEGEDMMMMMNMNSNSGVHYVVPNEADLVLLCLDYLRDLRRAYSSVSLLREQEGLKADYLTMACWALNRAFCPDHLPNLTSTAEQDGGNDCWHNNNNTNKCNTSFSSTTSSPAGFPSLEEMERELLYYKENPMDDSNNNNHHHHYNTTNSTRSHGDQKKEQDYDDDYSPSSGKEEQEEVLEQEEQQNHHYNSWYEYNDNHVSNAHRFYSLDGLASGPIVTNNNNNNNSGGGGSLTLGEIVAAGLVGLGARTRWQAEQEMLATPLFEQFVAAVKAKGFFDVSSIATTDHYNDTTTTTTLDSHHHHHHRRGSGGGSNNALEKMAAAQQQQQAAAQALYEERFRKVVAKFRVKLAHKAMMALPSLSQSPSVLSSSHNMDVMMMHGEQEETTQSTAGGGGGGGGGADWLGLVAALQQRKSREYRRGHNSNNNNAMSSATTPTNTASPGTPLDEPAPNRLQQQHQQQQHADEHHLLVERHDRYSNNNNKSSSSGNTHYHSNVENTSDVGSNVGTDVSVASYVKRTAFAQRLFDDVVSDQRSVITSSSAAAAVQTQAENHADLEEAERLKMNGNSFMKQKEYQKAADCYTAALKLSPAGPQAHVYFSNRAAALVSLRKFSKAILDSERSLSLKPDYGKAHARLGLAHFLLGNYRQAIQAYTLALKYEPDNKSSQSYMEKAEKRLAETRQSSSSSVSGEGVTVGRPPKKNGGHDVSNSYTTAARDENNHSHHHSSSSSVHGSSVGHRRSSSNTSHSTLLRDEKEAEKYKTKGNALMANREYSKALEAYNQAVRLSPTGPQSHVYYSNRAAALCYLERYQEAEEDSIQSLSFDPTYGKAHARLGLSRFFLQKYSGAVEAYSDALKYDPDNSASRSYLAKAKAKLSAAAPVARSSSSSSYNAVMTVSPPESTARRLMTDESLRIMTQRALQDPSRDLLNDPEMIRLSKKAMAAMRK